MSRLPFWWVSICSLPVGWLGFPRPLSGCVLVVAGAILGWHGQGSWLNFEIYLQPPHFTFTFSTNHFAAINVLNSICSLHISLSLSIHHLAAIYKVLNFISSLHISLSLFHKSSCCHHLALLPDHGMPPWDLLPPSAGPLRRGHLVF